jgi:hypothetical protein
MFSTKLGTFPMANDQQNIEKGAIVGFCCVWLGLTKNSDVKWL